MATTKTINIAGKVVLSGFQRYFCMQYTTRRRRWRSGRRLFYQDFNEQFVCKSTKNK